jgi:hypothetical protein
MRKVVLLAVMLVTIGSLFAELIPSVDKENALMSLINDSIYRDALYPNTVNIGFRSDIHKMVGRRLFFQLVKFSCKGESGKDFYYEQWFFVRYDEKSQEFVYAGSISDEIFEEAHKC